MPSAAASASATAASAVAPARVGVRVREGNVLARSVGDDALFLADEDHHVLRRIPLDPQIAAAALPLPGAPAQLLVLDDRILVTVRDPGLLLILRYAPATGFVELARVPLPADAWGVAVTPDESLALVTSAWTHQVSAVELATAKKRWSIDVPREPRAVVIREDGVGAYVTHLVGANLTRLSDLDKTTPKSSPLVLPAAAHRAPPGRVLDASLAYSAVLVDAGERLLVPRHALGAIGTNVWYGAPTVDVLLTKDDQALGPPHDEAALAQALGEVRAGYEIGANSRFAPSVEADSEQEIAQPRAAVYLRTKGSILVAPEGRDRLFELNAMALDPARDRRAALALGGTGSLWLARPGQGPLLSPARRRRPAPVAGERRRPQLRLPPQAQRAHRLPADWPRAAPASAHEGRARRPRGLPPHALSTRREGTRPRRPAGFAVGATPPRRVVFME